MPKSDMIEQHEVLMQLSHISYMRHDGNAKFAA